MHTPHWLRPRRRRYQEGDGLAATAPYAESWRHRAHLDSRMGHGDPPWAPAAPLPALGHAPPLRVRGLQGQARDTPKRALGTAASPLASLKASQKASSLHHRQLCRHGSHRQVSHHRRPGPHCLHRPGDSVQRRRRPTVHCRDDAGKWTTGRRGSGAGLAAPKAWKPRTG